MHAKTAGNPFFVLQFLHALADEGLLAFDHEAQRWSWDLDRIHAKGYTDNVVDLMVGKLARLPDETQEALQQLACLGNVADITTLAIVLGTSEEEVHAALWEAVRTNWSSARPRVPVRPRPSSGSRLFADPGGRAPRPTFGSEGFSPRTRLPRSGKRRSSRSSISSIAAAELITSQDERERWRSST